MGAFESFMQMWMPACVTFGPLFLVAAGKTPKAERFLRIAGLVMVIAALMTMTLTIDRQGGDISTLQLRLEYLEQKVNLGRK